MPRPLTDKSRLISQRAWEEQHLTAPPELRVLMWDRLKKVVRFGTDRDATNASKIVAEFDRIDVARQQLSDERGITIEARPIDAAGLAELQAFAAKVLLGINAE